MTYRIVKKEDYGVGKGYPSFVFTSRKSSKLEPRRSAATVT